MIHLIHTADWHLGQTFFGYERTHEHREFLEWLTAQITARHTDVLLIAGDLFDSPNPSAESQKIFYDFICNVTRLNNNLKIIIIAGNHDSAARLEAPNPLLESLNVTVRGLIRRTPDGEIDYERLIIPLNDESCCLAVPYLRQGDYPAADNHNDGIEKMYTRLVDIAKEHYKTIIAMGHLHANGGDLSTDDRSERTVIGGLDCIDPTIFDSRITYTALGHLHKEQRVAGCENIRYSGAPLPMSFAERNNKQGVTSVSIDENCCTTEKIIFDKAIKLLSIPATPKPIDEVIAEIDRLPEGDTDTHSPYIEIRVAISEPEPSLRNKIEKALENRAVRPTRIEAVTEQGTGNLSVPYTYEELKRIQPIELATDIFKQRYGGEDMPENIKELLIEVIREVEL